MDKQAGIELMTIEDPLRLDQLEVDSTRGDYHQDRPDEIGSIRMHPVGTLLGLATYDINPTTCLDVLVTVRAINKAKTRQRLDKKTIFPKTQTFAQSRERLEKVNQVPVRLVLKEDPDGSRWLPPTDEGIIVKMENDPEPDEGCYCCCRPRRKRDPLTYKSGESHKLSFYGY